MKAASTAAVLLVWTLACAAGCSEASNDPGLRAALRVENARFRAGELPRAADGPAIVDVRVSHEVLPIGTRGERLSGAIASHGNAVVLARHGDPGFWIVTAGLPTVDEPDYPTFLALLDLARDFPPGDFDVELSAVDREGRIGPRRTLALHAVQPVQDDELVVALRWDGSADLDLHVVDPAGTEIWARNIRSTPARDDAEDDAGSAPGGGTLDFDSNAQCAIDGRDEERVSWPDAPARGRYTVRVATASLCGLDAASWAVEVRLHGRSLAAARGVSLTTDTRKNASAGAGVLALSFVVP